jgi:hypothetical protein
MIFVDQALDGIGGLIARLLSRPARGYRPFAPADAETLERAMQPADVLLVEGNEKLSTGIKYLTQSTWSHAAIYIGDALGERDDGGRRLTLIEVNLEHGCVAVPLEKYECHNTRICRPVGLTHEDRSRVVQFMIDRLGLKYDMRNIIDLARYLLPTPPVPTRWRRRLIALGSGEPSKAICSTLIAQAFESVKYPILPRIERRRTDVEGATLGAYSRREILHIRHHSLFAPRDFDLSPYFKIVKPSIEHGFDYKRVEWAEADDDATVETPGCPPAEPPAPSQEAGTKPLDQLARQGHG